MMSRRDTCFLIVAILALVMAWRLGTPHAVSSAIAIAIAALLFYTNHEEAPGRIARCRITCNDRPVATLRNVTYPDMISSLMKVGPGDNGYDTSLPENVIRADLDSMIITLRVRPHHP